MAKKTLLASILSIFSLFSRNQNTNKSELDEFQIRIDVLKEAMLSYMEEAKPSYSKKDVEKCSAILKEYLKEMKGTTSKDQGMQAVKYTVLKINDLNNKCDDELIETEERERIAEIIILAGKEKGYNTVDEDITEEWREW